MSHLFRMMELSWQYNQLDRLFTWSVMSGLVAAILGIFCDMEDLRCLIWFCWINIFFNFTGVIPCMSVILSISWNNTYHPLVLYHFILTMECRLICACLVVLYHFLTYVSWIGITCIDLPEVVKGNGYADQFIPTDIFETSICRVTYDELAITHVSFTDFCSTLKKKKSF